MFTNSVKGEQSSSYKRTALAAHCEPEENGDIHLPDFNAVSVFATEKRYYKRLMLAHLNIRNENTYNNRSDEGAPMSASYCAVHRSHNANKCKSPTSTQTYSQSQRRQ